MEFYLGTHHPHWLRFVKVPLFVSRRRLAPYKKLWRARSNWALDSGGFTELDKYGRWLTGTSEYVENVQRYMEEIGGLDFVSPQDWMCEPQMLAKTEKSIHEHQVLTIENFLELRDKLGEIVMPVLQGWELDDYLNCVEMYSDAGIDLSKEWRVGVGSVCRRQRTSEVAEIFGELYPLRLHGFGVKRTGLEQYGNKLASSDSMAWSYAARRADRLPGCTGHKNCANCIRYAMNWYDDVVKEIA